MGWNPIIATHKHSGFPATLKGTLRRIEAASGMGA